MTFSSAELRDGRRLTAACRISSSGCVLTLCLATQVFAAVGVKTGDESFPADETLPMLLSVTQGIAASGVAADTDKDGVNDYREGKDGTNPKNASSFNPLSKGLLAFYPFNGSAADESGTGKNGDASRVKYVADRSGAPVAAANFRDNAYIEVRGLRSLKNYPITYSLWMYLENYQSSLSWKGWGGMQIIGKDEPGKGNGAVITIRTDDGNKNVLEYTGALLGGYVPPLGKWTHLALTIGTNRQATFFINGQKLRTWSATTQYNFEFTDLPFLISTPYLFDQFTRQSFQGSLDDVRIYDRALSAVEVENLYVNESGRLDSDGDGLIDAAEFLLEGLGFSPKVNDSAKVINLFSNPNKASLFTRAQYDAFGARRFAEGVSSISNSIPSLQVAATASSFLRLGLTASGLSGVAVTGLPSGWTVDPASRQITGRLTGKTPFTAVVTAQRGSNPAIPFSVTVRPLAEQTITFALPGTNTFRLNGTLSLGSKSSSGLPVTYTSGNTDILTINGSMAVMKSRGSTTITAVQRGNTNFGPASVTRPITLK